MYSRAEPVPWSVWNARRPGPWSRPHFIWLHARCRFVVDFYQNRILLLSKLNMHWVERASCKFSAAEGSPPRKVSKSYCSAVAQAVASKRFWHVV